MECRKGEKGEGRKGTKEGRGMKEGRKEMKEGKRGTKGRHLLVFAESVCGRIIFGLAKKEGRKEGRK